MSATSSFSRLLVAAALLGAGALAQADLIRITPLGVTVSEQDATGNISPVPIGAQGFRLTFHSNGQGGGNNSSTLIDPVLLILATPEGLRTSAPVINWSTKSDPTNLTPTLDLGGTKAHYGGQWDTNTGMVPAPFNASSKKNVYDHIGLTPDGVNSENYSNWTGATGLSSWDLWVYTIVFDPDMVRGNWAEFDASGLVAGSFVIGYGCTETKTTFLGGPYCRNEGNTQSTPFTFAGLVRVAEPGTVTLLGLGLLGLGLLRRRLG